MKNPRPFSERHPTVYLVLYFSCTAAAVVVIVLLFRLHGAVPAESRGEVEGYGLPDDDLISVSSIISIPNRRDEEKWNPPAPFTATSAKEQMTTDGFTYIYDPRAIWHLRFNGRLYRRDPPLPLMWLPDVLALEGEIR